MPPRRKAHGAVNDQHAEDQPDIAAAPAVDNAGGYAPGDNNEVSDAFSAEEKEDYAERGRRVPKFRQFFLPESDARAMAWETWHRLLVLFLDSDIINTSSYEKNRVAPLNCAFGSEGARIGAEHSPDDIGYDHTVKRLQQRLGNRQSRLNKRAKFFQCAKLATEDVLVYVIELRILASRCGFAANEEKRIRDRLLAGCRVDRIRGKLLLEPDDFTLADALKIVQFVERAVRRSGMLGPIASPSLPPRSVRSTRDSIVGEVHARLTPTLTAHSQSISLLAMTL